MPSYPFTPGPWISHQELLTPDGLHVAGRSPSVRKGQHIIAQVSRFLNHRLNENICQEAEANARLIAQAPELYKALDSLIMEWPQITEHSLEQAFKVLAAARDG